MNNFLDSYEAEALKILSDYFHPQLGLRFLNIKNTVVIEYRNQSTNFSNDFSGASTLRRFYSFVQTLQKTLVLKCFVCTFLHADDLVFTFLFVFKKFYGLGIYLSQHQFRWLLTIGWSGACFFRLESLIFYSFHHFSGFCLDQKNHKRTSFSQRTMWKLMLELTSSSWSFQREKEMTRVKTITFLLFLLLHIMHSTENQITD